MGIKTNHPNKAIEKLFKKTKAKKPKKAKAKLPKKAIENHLKKIKAKFAKKTKAKLPIKAKKTKKSVLLKKKTHLKLKPKKAIVQKLVNRVKKNLDALKKYDAKTAAKLLSKKLKTGTKKAFVKARSQKKKVLKKKSKMQAIKIIGQLKQIMILAAKQHTAKAKNLQKMIAGKIRFFRKAIKHY